MLGGDGAVPGVQHELVARLGGARGTGGALGAGRGVFGAAHVGAEQQHDDGRVEHHNDLRQREGDLAGRRCGAPQATGRVEDTEEYCRVHGHGAHQA